MYVDSRDVSKCRPCGRKSTRNWYNSESGKWRDKISTAARRYGITRERAEEMYLSPCDSCGTTDEQIHIDHDHDTGAVRGSLCRGCNISLGLLGENPDRILALYMYAKEL